MKAGDLIHMPGQHCPGDDSIPSIGIVIDDVPISEAIPVEA